MAYTYSCDHTFFDSVDTEQKAYWLGFFAADGSVSPYGVLKLTLAMRDGAHVASFREALRSNHPISPYVTAKGYTGIRLSIYSPSLRDALSRLNCPPNKTLILRFPDFDDDLLRHYVRGYVDGDGCYYIGDVESRDSFGVVGPIPFLQQFRAFLTDYTDIPRNQITPAGRVGRLRYCGKWKRRIADFLYQGATVYLERKFLKAYPEREPVVPKKPGPKLRTHCCHGHPYDTRNTGYTAGRRYCRACVNSRCLAYQAKRRRAGEET